MAMRSGRTKTYFVTKLIREGLADLEDHILAEQAVAEYLAAGGKDQPTYTLEEVLRGIEKGRVANSTKPTSKKPNKRPRPKK
jgi:predicted transcriptional regulator